MINLIYIHYLIKVKCEMFFKSQNNINDLAYWLSTTCTLVFLVQSTLKATSATDSASRRNRTSPATIFGRNRTAHVSFHIQIYFLGY